MPLCVCPNVLYSCFAPLCVHNHTAVISAAKHSSLRTMATAAAFATTSMAVVHIAVIIAAAALVAAHATVDTVWIDAEALTVGGRAFPANATPPDRPYARLPAAALAHASPGVARWAVESSAGITVSFATNAAAVSLRYSLVRPATAWTHDASTAMPPIGDSGCDLYRLDSSGALNLDDLSAVDGSERTHRLPWGVPAGLPASASTWRWVASCFDGLAAAHAAAPPLASTVTEEPLFADSVGWPVGPLPPFATLNATYEYRLHLAAFNGVTAVAIGVPRGAVINPLPASRAAPPALAVYGSTAAQGAFTPRPGVAWPTRLGRLLDDRAVYNFAFAGSCLFEEALVPFFANVPAAGGFLIDCGYDLPVDALEDSAVAFVAALRAALPATVPVVVVEPPDCRPTWLVPDAPWTNLTGRRAALRRAYGRLQASGAVNLHYVNGSLLYASTQAASTEPTLDGLLPLDSGHRLISDALSNILATVHAGGQVDDTGRSEDPQAEENKRWQDKSPAATLSWGGDGVRYVDATLLSIRGRAFTDTPGPYARLPASAQGVVRDAVWALSLQSAGVVVAFASDSPTLWLEYAAAAPFEPMPHFSAMGVGGMDLYAWDNDTSLYRFVATVTLPYGESKYSGPLTPAGVAVGKLGLEQRWLLYMPTYNSPANVSGAVMVGVEAGAMIRADDPFPGRGTGDGIVWYGTSILQGGVNMRPGNIFTSVVSRGLGREVFNFGFSGNGKMELTVAEFLTRVPAAVIIVDCMWNMDAGLVNSSAVPLVDYLRKNGHSRTPIVLAEGLPFGRNWAVPAQAAFQTAENAALRAAYELLVAGGDSAVFYVTTEELFSAGSVEDSATASGLHPTDAGMYDMAQAWLQVLPEILASLTHVG
jgi:hypothetical protein